MLATGYSNSTKPRALDEQQTDREYEATSKRQPSRKLGQRRTKARPAPNDYTGNRVITVQGKIFAIQNAVHRGICELHSCRPMVNYTGNRVMGNPVADWVPRNGIGDLQPRSNGEVSSKNGDRRTYLRVNTQDRRPNIREPENRTIELAWQGPRCILDRKIPNEMATEGQHGYRRYLTSRALEQPRRVR